jgi:hypothetical protein
VEAWNPATVVIADDHPVYRDGLARAVAGRAELRLAGEAADGKEAARLIDARGGARRPHAGIDGITLALDQRQGERRRQREGDQERRPVGDPVPRRIEAALVGDPSTDAAAVKAVQGVAAETASASPNPKSTVAAFHAIDVQSSRLGRWPAAFRCATVGMGSIVPPAAPAAWLSARGSFSAAG